MGQGSNLVSVIIPTFNRKDMLLETLARVEAQTHSELETIVVDDGSTDGTAEALDGMPGVRCLRQENAGPSAARNRGMTEARGDYLAFLDSDDLWEPGFLAKCLEGLRRTGAGFVFANWRILRHPDTPLAPDAFAERPLLMERLRGRDEEWIELTPDVARDLFLRKSFIMPSGLVFRASWASHAWDEETHVGEDQQFILEGLFANDATVACTREVHWAYRFHDSNYCTDNPDRERVSRGEIRIKQRLLDRYGEKMTGAQKATLNASVADSWFDLGYHTGQAGRLDESLEAYRNSWRLKRTARTFLACLKARWRRRS